MDLPNYNDLKGKESKQLLFDLAVDYRRLRHGFDDVHKKIDSMIEKQSEIEVKVTKLDFDKEGREKIKDRLYGLIIGVVVIVVGAYFVNSMVKEGRSYYKREDLEYNVKSNGRNQ
jgi:hypothetical protein